MKTVTKLLALAAVCALASCGDDQKSADTGTGPALSTDSNISTGADLAGILLPEAPANAVSVSEARKNHTAGTEVVVTGDIIGKLEVFIENRAMLTLGDPDKITSCNRISGDECETPWDVCCDDPDTIKASIATVQVVDEDGKLVKQGLKGVGNMKELSILTVKGTVAEGSSAENLIINATGIHIASVEPRK